MVPAAEAVGLIGGDAAVIGDEFAHDGCAVGVIDFEKDFARAIGVEVEVPHVETDGEVLAIGIDHVGGDAFMEAEGLGRGGILGGRLGRGEDSAGNGEQEEEQIGFHFCGVGFVGRGRGGDV